MIDLRSRVGDELERAVLVARLRDPIVRALALWETWIIVASVAYLAGHFYYWSALGYRVVGQ